MWTFRRGLEWGRVLLSSFRAAAQPVAGPGRRFCRAAGPPAGVAPAASLRARLRALQPRRSASMSLSMHQASVPVFRQVLTNLSAIVDKAVAHAAARKIDPA